MSEPSYDFDYDAVDRGNATPPVSITEQQLPVRLIVCRVLDLLTSAGTPLLAGQLAYLLNFGLKNSPYAKKQDLAQALGVTPGRVSQILQAQEAVLDEALKWMQANSSQSLQGLSEPRESDS